MRKLLLTTIASIAIISFSIAQTNLITNGGFEDSPKGSTTAANWWFQEVVGGITYTVNTDDVYKGNKSLFVLVSTLGTNAWDRQFATNDLAGIELNNYYRYTIWAKGNGEAAKDSAIVNFTIGITSSPWSELAYMYGKVLSKDWQKIVITFYNKTETSLRTPMHLVRKGEYFFDEASLIKSSLAIAETSPGGDSIKIQFGWKIDSTKSTNLVNSFKLLINKTEASIKEVKYDKMNPYTIYLLSTTRISKTDSVKVNYDNMLGDIYYSESTAPKEQVETFNEEVVENFVGNVQSNTISRKYEINTLKVFPSPVINNLTISSDQTLEKVEIITLSGTLLIRVAGNLQHKQTINVSMLHKGIYIIKVNDLMTLRFVK